MTIDYQNNGPAQQWVSAPFPVATTTIVVGQPRRAAENTVPLRAFRVGSFHIAGLTNKGSTKRSDLGTVVGTKRNRRESAMEEKMDMIIERALAMAGHTNNVKDALVYFATAAEGVAFRLPGTARGTAAAADAKEARAMAQRLG